MARPCSAICSTAPNTTSCGFPRSWRSPRRRCPGRLPVPPGSTTVESTLEPVAEGTPLRLVHSGLPSPEACAAHEEGWAHYVDRLATVAAGGDPGPDNWM
ncbi:SRPBCC family protein [Streptomyces montanus]|uniref:SRPBCC family protein n=1 Tax=Streptomyces montanus TaxID=2580423 RepID=UPI00248283E5|nr:SRPBCC domain-containing protein [Streptomyces montanus]